MFLLFCLMLSLFLACLSFVFVLFCFLLCFQTLKNTVFPVIMVFFEPCWLEGRLFSCFMLLFLFFSCVVCFQSKQ